MIGGGETSLTVTKLEEKSDVKEHLLTDPAQRAYADRPLFRSVQKYSMYEPGQARLLLLLLCLLVGYQVIRRRLIGPAPIDVIALTSRGQLSLYVRIIPGCCPSLFFLSLPLHQQQVGRSGMCPCNQPGLS